MYRMILKEQAEVLARITATSPWDSERSEAIAAARRDRATAQQAVVVHAALQRYAELAEGLEYREAARALEEGGEPGGAVRWYRDAPRNHRV